MSSKKIKYWIDTKSLWYLDKVYDFSINGKRNLKFQFSWFTRWERLVYLKIIEGTFYCVFFSLYYNVVGSQPLELLFKVPFPKWKNAIENVCNHDEPNTHLNNVT